MSERREMVAPVKFEKGQRFRVLGTFGGREWPPGSEFTVASVSSGGSALDKRGWCIAYDARLTDGSLEYLGRLPDEPAGKPPAAPVVADHGVRVPWAAGNVVEHAGDKSHWRLVKRLAGADGGWVAVGLTAPYVGRAGDVMDKYVARFRLIADAPAEKAGAPKLCPTCGSRDLDDRGNCWTCLEAKNPTPMDPLPRCAHGGCLVDHSGELLEPSCGCRYQPPAPAPRTYACRLGEVCTSCNPPKREPFRAAVDDFDLLRDA